MNLTVTHFFKQNAQSIVTSEFWTFGTVVHFITFVTAIGISYKKKNHNELNEIRLNTF